MIILDSASFTWFSLQVVLGPTGNLQTFGTSHKGAILLHVALLHHPAPGHGRSTQTPVLSVQNHILNLPLTSHFVEPWQEFLCWVIHLCTWFGNTFETKQASQE